jgi:hypothetical protein
VGEPAALIEAYDKAHAPPQPSPKKQKTKPTAASPAPRADPKAAATHRQNKSFEVQTSANQRALDDIEVLKKEIAKKNQETETRAKQTTRKLEKSIAQARREIATRKDTLPKFVRAGPLRALTGDDKATLKIVVSRYKTALRAVFKEFSREPNLRSRSMTNASDLMQLAPVDELLPSTVFQLLGGAVLQEREVDILVVASNREHDKLDHASLDFAGFLDVLSRCAAAYADRSTDDTAGLPAGFALKQIVKTYLAPAYQKRKKNALVFELREPERMVKEKAIALKA